MQLIGEDFRETLHVKNEWRSHLWKILPQTITICRVRTLVNSQEDYQGMKNEVIWINVINELFLTTLHIPLRKIVYNIGLMEWNLDRINQ